MVIKCKIQLINHCCKSLLASNLTIINTVTFLSCWKTNYNIPKELTHTQSLSRTHKKLLMDLIVVVALCTVFHQNVGVIVCVLCILCFMCICTQLHACTTKLLSWSWSVTASCYFPVNNSPFLVLSKKFLSYILICVS